jgi:hypothetical protein
MATVMRPGLLRCVRMRDSARRASLIVRGLAQVSLMHSAGMRERLSRVQQHLVPIAKQLRRGLAGPTEQSARSVVWGRLES